MADDVAITSKQSFTSQPRVRIAAGVAVLAVAGFAIPCEALDDVRFIEKGTMAAAAAMTTAAPTHLFVDRFRAVLCRFIGAPCLRLCIPSIERSLPGTDRLRPAGRSSTTKGEPRQPQREHCPGGGFGNRCRADDGGRVHRNGVDADDVAVEARVGQMITEGEAAGRGPAETTERHGKHRPAFRHRADRQQERGEVAHG